jgi:hypothetical protein
MNFYSSRVPTNNKTCPLCQDGERNQILGQYNATNLKNLISNQALTSEKHGIGKCMSKKSSAVSTDVKCYTRIPDHRLVQQCITLTEMETVLYFFQSNASVVML